MLNKESDSLKVTLPPPPQPISDDSTEKAIEIPKTYLTILGGGLSGVISKTCTAPLERVQMLHQTGAYHDGILVTLRKIYAMDGVRGYWKGNIANCVRVFPHKSLLFCVNDQLRHYIPSQSPLISFLTGATAGAIATIGTYPIDVVRAHLAGTFGQETRMINVTRNMIAEGGVASLFVGLGVTLVGALPYEGLRIGVYSSLRPHLPTTDTKYGPQPHPIAKLASGAAAGAAAGIGTYPTDTIRRMLQVQGADGLPKFSGVWHCVRSTIQTQGVSRFYHGLSAKLFRVVPDTMILFMAYEMVKDYLLDIYFHINGNGNGGGDDGRRYRDKSHF